MQANPSTPIFSSLLSSQQGLPCLSRLLWEQQTQFPAISAEAVQAVGEMHAVAHLPITTWEGPDWGDMLMTLRDPTFKSLWVSRHAAPAPLNGGQAGFP